MIRWRPHAVKSHAYQKGWQIIFFLLYPFSFTLYLKLTQLKQKVYCDVKNIDLIYCVLTFAGGFVIYVKSYSLFTLKLF